MIITLKITNSDSDQNIQKWVKALEHVDPAKVALFMEEGGGWTNRPAAGVRVEYRNHYNQFPQDDNAVFQAIASYARDVAQEAFLYVEADATPRGDDWFLHIQAEYERAKAVGFAYMGDLVAINGMPDSLAPVGVYPRSLIHNGAGEAMLAHEQPWTFFVPHDKVYKTPLIRHAWEETTPEMLGNECVLVHPDRDGRFSGVSHSEPGEPIIGSVQDLNSTAAPELISPASDHNQSPLEATEDGAGGFQVPTIEIGQRWLNTKDNLMYEFNGKKWVPVKSDLYSDDQIKWTPETSARVRDIVAELKSYCDCPMHRMIVRQELEIARIIKKGSQKFRRRRKYLRSKK